MSKILVMHDNIGRWVHPSKLGYWKNKGATVVDEKDHPKTKESEELDDDDVSGEFTGNVDYDPDEDDKE